MKDETKTVLAWTGAGALVYFVGKSAIDTFVSNVQVHAGNPSIDTTPFANGFIQTTVPVTVTNNNFFPVGIKSFYGRVNYGQLSLANVSLPIGFYVPPGATRQVALDMDIPVLDITNDIALLIQQGSVWNALMNKITLNGTLHLYGNFTNIPIPLNNIVIPII